MAIISVLVEAKVLTVGNRWDLALTQAWDQSETLIPATTLAESYYRIGYETGVNMDRVHRGLDYANQALELDPAHVKAKMLQDRLTPIAKERYRLIGD